jgi:Immunity protein 27
MGIELNETLIRGGWQSVEGRMVPDATLVRIRALVDTQLEKIGSTGGGWEMLYRDTLDGRLWDLFYPQGEMQGGGPESLRCIDSVLAEHKYGLKLDALKR